MGSAYSLDDTKSDTNAGQPALAAVSMKSDILLSHVTVRIQLRVGHRSTEYPVLKRHAVDGAVVNKK